MGIPVLVRDGLSVPRIICAFVLLSVAHLTSLSQDFDWTLKKMSGEELSRVALNRLSGDTLFFSRSRNFSDWIVVGSIRELRRERTSAVLPATIIGAAAGGVAGAVAKPVARNQEEANIYSAVFGVVIGGVGGFLIGSNIQSDEVIDLQKGDANSRIEMINKILNSRPAISSAD